MTTSLAKRAHEAAILALLVILGLALPQSGSASAVALIQSGTLAPYQQASAAFVTAYGAPVTTFMLDESDPAGMLRRVEGIRPEVIVAVGLKAVLFARSQLPRTPLVFCVVPNHERFDLGGAWVSGVSADVPAERDLAALRLAAPDAGRVGLIFGRGTGEALARRARSAARAAGLLLVEAPVSNLSELQRVAGDLAGRVDALWLPADPTVATPEAFRFLLELSLEQRKPLLVFSESLVRAGALVGVAPDYAWMGSQAAEIVRRIQSGDRAGDIGVVPLARSHVVLNQATARALGRVLPPATLTELEVLK